MELIDINSEYIVCINGFDKSFDDNFIYHPKNDKKWTWKDRLFRNEMICACKESPVIETQRRIWWWNEDEFLKFFPHMMIEDNKAYTKPHLLISLSNGNTISMYFRTYVEVCSFVKWMEGQNGYIRLKHNEFVKNCYIL